MSENARLNGGLDDIDVDVTEREATPRLLMKLGIQLHLAGLSLSNTIAILEVFGVERDHSTVHNWVHKADLQPEDGRSPDHVAVDETVIRLNDEQYWLYAAIDPETNESLHTTLEPTTNKILDQSFSLNSPRNMMLRKLYFLLMARIHYNTRVVDTASILDMNSTEIGTASNVSFFR